MNIPSLTELLIVATGFGIVGLYMFIAHTIVKSGEGESRARREFRSPQ